MEMTQIFSALYIPNVIAVEHWTSRDVGILNFELTWSSQVKSDFPCPHQKITIIVHSRVEPNYQINIGGGGGGGGSILCYG